MNLTNTIEITARARIAPADSLAISGERYSLGWNNKVFEIAETGTSAGNQVHTRSVTLAPSTAKTFNLDTMEFQTVDGGVAPKNPDGVAYNLTKIFFIAIEVTGVDAGAGDLLVADSVGNNTLRAELKHLNSTAVFLNPTTGWAIVAGDKLTFTNQSSVDDVTFSLMLIGYQA